MGCFNTKKTVSIEFKKNSQEENFSATPLKPKIQQQENQSSATKSPGKENFKLQDKYDLCIIEEEKDNQNPIPIVAQQLDKTEQQNQIEQKKADKISMDEEKIKIAPSNFIVEHKKEAIKQNYKILEKIGSGSFGKVYKVNHLPTNQFRAMKVISKETLQYQDDDKKFLKEIEILSQLDHPNILKVFEYYQDSENYFIIIELCRGGELYEQISEISCFNERDAANIMEQLISAVIYIHSKNIVHRDLKPENILLENKGNKNLFIKIIDFGTSNYFDKNTKLNLKVGTPYYIAPEVLKKSYSNKCDIWSCGVIMYILLTGSPPFNGNDEDEIMKSVAIGKYSLEGEEWTKISKDAKNLIEKLLKYDPEKRISAEMAWKHPWITKNVKQTSTSDASDHFIPISNIRFFTSRKKFQQATIAFLVHQASTSEMMKELRRIFKEFDKNGDGQLSYDEIKAGFKQYFKNEQLADIELNKLIANIDLDKNNYIEYEEFLRVTVNLDLLMTDKNLKMAFDFFDKDKSGKLSHDEIKDALCKDGYAKENEVIQNIIREIDLNGDGQIEFAEFKQLMVKVISDLK